MPEFGVGEPLLPAQPPTFQDVLDRLKALRAVNQANQDRIDKSFVDAVNSLTGINLTEAVEAGRRSESIGGGAIGPEALLIDQLLTAPTSSSADLPPGVDARGRPRSINQNQQTGFAVGPDGKLVEVQMLAMWNADP